MDEEEEVEDCNKDFEEPLDFTVTEIPRNILITAKQMSERKCLDLKRWYCLARPQYSKSCGISSLTSCWNYLFSTLGHGSHRPISTEEALEVVGFKPPYGDISFGKITGNDTLIKWFKLLNLKFGMKGEARISFKLHGASITNGIDSAQALNHL